MNEDFNRLETNEKDIIVVDEYRGFVQASGTILTEFKCKECNQWAAYSDRVELSSSRKIMCRTCFNKISNNQGSANSQGEANE